MSVSSSAVSNVGKVRASNQDSGFAGQYLNVVADGMGGHAGGDVASHLVIRQLLALDKHFDSVDEARDELVSTLLMANDMLSDVVFEHPELAGLGTTASAMLRVGDQVVIAHIGDSRVYLLREGNLSQVTVDHTFVQRLIDSGRITEEEAHSHPRRSVLMRVLGDVDATPEIDTMVLDTREGDVWMLCSDGLTTVVWREELAELMTSLPADADVDVMAAALIDASLDGGAPDNVTVVITRTTSGEPTQNAELVGSAAGVLPVQQPEPRLIPPVGKRPKPRPLPVHTGGMKLGSAGLTAQLDAVRATRIRRRIGLIIGAIVLVGALLIAGIAGYRWSQTQFYLGVDNDSVVIYQGLAQPVGPFSLSHAYLDTNVLLTSLTPFQRDQITATVPAGSLAEAQTLVNALTTPAK
jgi:serine/threonine protein phosphatase PrpC